MDSEKIKRVLDACYLAKRAREMLPKLPDGVSPAYIQYLDQIHILHEQKEHIKVSDISDALNLPRPGVTRTIKAMEEKGYLKKISSDEDGRVTYIAVTEKGETLWNKYDRNYYRRLAPYLENISNEEADGMIHTIEKFYQVMSERRVDIE